LQLAFEHAVVGIEEAQLHAGARLVAEEVDLDRRRAQLDGLARVGIDGDDRWPPVGRRHEFEGLGRLRDRAERQRRQAEAGGSGGLEETDGDARSVCVWHENPFCCWRCTLKRGSRSKGVKCELFLRVQRDCAAASTRPFSSSTQPTTRMRSGLAPGAMLMERASKKRLGASLASGLRPSQGFAAHS
jgi:hypothetical protein